MTRWKQPIGIHELREQLCAAPGFERDTVHEAVRRLSATPAELRRYIQFRPDGYTRTRFHRDERFEILVLAWLPGQVSPIHDHARSICTMHVLDGTCQSTTYRRSPESGRRPLIQEATVHLTAGSTITVYGGDIHAIGCPLDVAQGLVTVHFYLPPIQEMLVFDPKTGEGKPMTAVTLDPMPETTRV